MRHACAMAAVAVVLAGLAVRPAGAQESLVWKLGEGDAFTLESVTRTTQDITMKEDGKDVTTKEVSTITTRSNFRVIKKDGDRVTLEQKIESVKVEPESDPTQNIAGRFANLLKGLTLTVSLGPTGRDLTVSGYTNWLKSISAGDEAIQRQLRSQMLPEENLKEELAQVFSILPDKPVGPGATWTRKEKFQMGPRGTIEGTVTYRYEGRTDKGDRITANRALTYEPFKEDKPADKPVEKPEEKSGGKPGTKPGTKPADKPASPPPPPAPVFSMDQVKMGPAGGEYLFDAARGRLVEGTLTSSLEGTVTVTTADKKNAIVEVKQSTRRTLKVGDKEGSKPAK